MFGKKKERHKSGEALNIEENGTLQQSSLNPATSLREQGDIIEVTLDRTLGGLGFSITGGADNQILEGNCGFFITNIMKNGSAALDGRLRVGDMLVKIENESLINERHKKAVKMLQKAPKRVRLTVRRNHLSQRLLAEAGIIPPEVNSVASQNRPPRIDRPRTIEVSLDVSSKGLGITIAGGVGNEHVPGDSSIFITSIFANGSAYGVLEAGTRLISIDDCEITREMHEEVVEMLNNCGERVNLRIQRPRSSKALNIVENEFAELRIVQICRLALGLGFNIVGGEMDNQGIFISYLHPTGVAESTGKINEGDQIIAVNNISFLNISHRDAVNILRSVDDFIVIELSFQPDKFHKLKEEIWQLREQNRRKVQHCDSVKL